MSIEEDHERRISQLENTLKPEKFATKENLEEIKNNSLAEELKAKEKRADVAIGALLTAIVLSGFGILLFQIKQAPNYPNLVEALTQFLNTLTDIIK